MSAEKRLGELFQNYEETRNPLFLLEALLLCLSENIPLPGDLADWLAERLWKYLNNVTALNGQSYRSLDECFQVGYNNFEKYRLADMDGVRAVWSNALKYVFGLSNEKSLEALESMGVNVSGFKGRYERGFSKAEEIKNIRKKRPVPEDAKDAIYKSMKPETQAIIDRRRRKK